MLAHPSRLGRGGPIATRIQRRRAPAEVDELRITAQLDGEREVRLLQERHLIAAGSEASVTPARRGASDLDVLAVRSSSRCKRGGCDGRDGCSAGTGADATDGIGWEQRRHLLHTVYAAIFCQKTF